MTFSYFKHYFLFLNVNEHLAVPFVEFARVGTVWPISISFVCTELLVSAFPQSHRLNLTYCSKSSLSLASLLHYFFLFLMLINTRQFHLSNCQKVGPVYTISISFVYTELLVRAIPQSHRLNLTYCSKSSLLLTFCFLFVCMVDQAQMCPSSISP